MLNIYECTPEVCIDGEWMSCSIWARTRALEDPTQTEIWYPTFADLVSACERKVIVNAEVVTTFYNKKPLCKISTAWRDFPIRIGAVQAAIKVNRTDLFLRVDIGYGDALKHRKSTGKYLCPYQWEDLTVDVYI